MEDIGIKVVKIKKKIEQLIVVNSTLANKNEQLIATIDQLVKKKKEQEERIASLEAALKARQLSEGLTESMGSSKLAKQTIKRILREIDRCIALINSARVDGK